MMGDKKKVPDVLKKFGVGQDITNPIEWLPKDQPANPLSPGLQELTTNRPYDRIGITDKDKPLASIKCRFCGSDLYFLEETNNAIVMACPYELCPNNPDGPFSNYYYEKAARKVGTIRENVFGEI